MNDDPRIDPADLRHVKFPGSSRRYEARAVDEFLETVAERVAATNALVDELQQRPQQSPAASAAPAPAREADLSTLDSEELVRLIGQETAAVLLTARRSGDEIRRRAQEEAAEALEKAAAEAERLTVEATARADSMTSEAEQSSEAMVEAARAEAERVRSEANAEAERVRTEANAEAERVLTEANAEAERVRTEGQAAIDEQQAAIDKRLATIDAEAAQILVDAREEGRRMVTEARETRERVFDDLRRRGDLARTEIERLLAGRDRLLAAYQVVRENLDDITTHVAQALSDDGDAPDGFAGAVGSSTEELVTEPEEVDDTVAPAGAAVPDDTTASPDDAGDDVADEVGSTPDASEDLPVADLDEGAPAVEAEPERLDAAEPDAEGSADPEAEGAAEAVAEPDDEAVAEPELTQEPSDPTADVVTEGAGEAEDELEATDEPEAVDEAPVEASDEPPVEESADLEPEGALDEPVEASDEAEVADEASSDDAAEDAGEAAAVGGGQRVEEPPQPAVTDRLPQRERHGGAAAQVSPAFLAGEDDLRRRTEALEPLNDQLARALKRRLTDEQNEVLDALRRSGTADAALPDYEAHLESYSSPAMQYLSEAVTAASPDVDAHVPAMTVARSLAVALVDPLRRRIEDAAAETGDDADALDEQLRGVYREAKSQHIAAAAQDALLSAYARGTLAGAREGSTVRWLIDPEQGPCPDALDNALQGFVVAGRPFPTGHVCPQAHPGCRCFLEAD